MFFFFFFQAEDGIRDKLVTGVQTCALPIYAGLWDAEAWRALRPLVEGTLENLTRQEPVAALTGPVARGDEETIRRHLDVLTRDDAALYRALGRTALELAQKRGMDEATAARVAAALATDLPPVLRPEYGW